MKYISGKFKSKSRLYKAIIIGVFLLLIISGAVGTKYWYQQQLKPVSLRSEKVVVTIPSGYSTPQIGELLQNNDIIRSATAFEWYVRNSNLRDSLKAGQYELDPSQSIQEIAAVIAQGIIQKNLFTILPGQRLYQIKEAFIRSGYDEAQVDAAFEPSNYQDMPALIAKPTFASLEGYLYPESFQTTSDTVPADIIKQSLDQMAQVLTPELIGQFQKQGLGIHRAITLASIIEQEASKQEDRNMIAGIFYNRLRANKPLESDVTYKYAAIETGQDPSPFIDSPYNTYKVAELPIGPICNVSESSLEAVANPTPSDYLYFVFGDDGKVYYSKTIEEHEQLAKEHCKELCRTY